ncbi:hypothetical protein [Anoxynatronum sibiricum]|uniref:hypothetical protein n=1 Tax=Anoxynatronum sibiricum TaxID=210623 RepID=UPI0031B84577
MKGTILCLFLLLLSLGLSGCNGGASSQEEAFDSVESYLDFAAGKEDPAPPDTGPQGDVQAYGDITPTDWRRLFDQADQPYLVMIGSVYCEPCYILEETVLSAYRSAPRQVPYYHFEIGDYPIRVNWLLEQPFWAQVQEETGSEFPVTPTLLRMQGEVLLAYRVGLMDLEAFLELAEGRGVD